MKLLPAALKLVHMLMSQASGETTAKSLPKVPAPKAAIPTPPAALGVVHMLVSRAPGETTAKSLPKVPAPKAAIPKSAPKPTPKASRKPETIKAITVPPFADFLAQAAPIARTEPAPRVPTAKETAAAIIAAAAKARGIASSRFASERIRDMMTRSGIDHAAGQAASILRSGAKARGETI